ncbi:TPT-domain-containing protein [Testicularia cyperi]|uniref:TPT-domain-containing protein n=1 Tax=Testicularia cyperi TaxID=1882483 RepID=A0A317XF90_9BASI|nr:TPT-domain-containing protein [Testicularia cyperi]
MNAVVAGARAHLLEGISRLTGSGASSSSSLPTSFRSTHTKEKRSIDRPRLFTSSLKESSQGSASSPRTMVESLPSRSTLFFVLGCLAWYTSSSLSSNTSKALLSKTRSEELDFPTTVPPAFPYPVTLTLIHFCFVNVCCAICASPAIFGRRALSRLVKPSWNRVAEVGQLAFFNVLGQALSSVAISRVPVSTVHTIKALSPLFTVLSYTFLFNVNYSSKTYVSLLPLTAGVMMACTGFSFSANDVTGFGAALGSTCIFVAQNIYSKKLLRKGENNPGIPGTDSEKLDKINILFYTSGCSIVLMIPMALYYDGAAMFSRPSWVATPEWPLDRGSLVLWLLLCNGLVHFAQNILAFNVLAMVSPVTYSIASLLKRIFVIVLAIFWFHQSVSLLQWIGIALTFYGLWMYNDSKTRDDVDKGEKHVSRRQDTLPTGGILPLTSSGSQETFLPTLVTSSTSYHFSATSPASSRSYQQTSYTQPRNVGGWNDVPDSMLASTPHKSYIKDPTKSLPSPPDSDKE